MWSYQRFEVLICTVEMATYDFFFTHKNVDICPLQLWAEKVFGMYTSWARKQGYKVGLIEKIFSTSGHIRSAAMEIESEYMFGILSGEKGMHQIMFSSPENSDIYQVIMFSVVICQFFIRIHQELLSAKFKLTS